MNSRDYFVVASFSFVLLPIASNRHGIPTLKCVPSFCLKEIIKREESNKRDCLRFYNDQAIRRKEIATLHKLHPIALIVN